MSCDCITCLNYGSHYSKYVRDISCNRCHRLYHNMGFNCGAIDCCNYIKYKNEKWFIQCYYNILDFHRFEPISDDCSEWLEEKKLLCIYCIGELIRLKKIKWMGCKLQILDDREIPTPNPCSCCKTMLEGDNKKFPRYYVFNNKLYDTKAIIFGDTTKEEFDWKNMTFSLKDHVPDWWEDYSILCNECFELKKDIFKEDIPEGFQKEKIGRVAELERIMFDCIKFNYMM